MKLTVVLAVLIGILVVACSSAETVPSTVAPVAKSQATSAPQPTTAPTAVPTTPATIAPTASPTEVPTATPVPTVTPTTAPWKPPTPRPTPTPEYSDMYMQCSPIGSEIAAYALENAYEYGGRINKNGALVNESTYFLDVLDTWTGEADSLSCASYSALAGLTAGFQVGMVNVYLSVSLENISGIQKEIFGETLCLNYEVCTERSLLELPYPYETMGFLTDGVMKVSAQDLVLPQFLYEMSLSSQTISELQNSGLEGEILAKHYYKNYEDEWTNWFKSEDSKDIEKLRISLSLPTPTPPPPAAININPVCGKPGDAVVISGTGFPSDGEVSVWYEYPNGQGEQVVRVSLRSSSFNEGFTIPSEAPVDSTNTLTATYLSDRSIAPTVTQKVVESNSSC